MAPSAHTAEVPDNLDVDNGGAIVLGVRFMVSEETERDGVEFYAPATNTGTYTAMVWQTTADDDPANSGTGTELMTAVDLASAGVTPGEWNTITHDPLTYSPGVVYTAAVRSSSGRYVSSPTGLDAGLTGNGIILVDNNTDPNPPGLGTIVNGVFVEGALAYPVSTFNSSDYFIDISQAASGDVSVVAAATLGGLAGAATVGRTVIGTAAATLGALAGAAAVDVSATVTATATLGGLTATAAVTSVPGAGARSGGWQSLLDIVRDARDTRDREVSAPPSACWRCGEPLSVGSTGELRCRFDGWSPR